MKHFASSFFAWVREVTDRWWRPQPVAAPAPKRAYRKRSEIDQVPGEFYFREAILDHLDAHFEILKTMKRGDAVAYQLFGQAGVQILPSHASFQMDSLSGRLAEAAPSMGAVALPGGDTPESVSPRILYFQKVKSLRNVALPPPGSALYECTAYFMLRKDQPVPVKFPILLMGGKAVALRQHLLQPLTRSRKGRDFYIPARQPGFDYHLQQWAGENKRPVAEHLAVVFQLAANAWEVGTQNSMTRISVRKDRLTAAFSVNVQRTPYFFADRDVTFGAKRKKIFHIVRAHERETKSGTSAVRMHFRGARQFDWQGYAVTISVPGWHHPDQYDLAASAHTDIAGPTPDNMIGPEATGALIADAMAQSRKPISRTVRVGT